MHVSIGDRPKGRFPRPPANASTTCFVRRSFCVEACEENGLKMGEGGGGGVGSSAQDIEHFAFRVRGFVWFFTNACREHALNFTSTIYFQFSKEEGRATAVRFAALLHTAVWFGLV